MDVQLRVAGDVPPDVLAELGNTNLVRRGVETVLRGPVEDQAALIGLINWLQMLGLELREVREVTGSDADSEPGHPRSDR